MLHFLKLMLLILRGLFYDNKEELNFRSKEFNSRKFIIFAIMIMSLALNAWLFVRFYNLGTEFIEYRENAAQVCPMLENQQQKSHPRAHWIEPKRRFKDKETSHGKQQH